MLSPAEQAVNWLSCLIGTLKAPVAIDISIDGDANDGLRLIPGSRRHPCRDIAGLASKLAGRLVAVKLSMKSMTGQQP